MKIRTGKDKAWYGITRIPRGAPESATYSVSIRRQCIQVGRKFATSRYGGEEGAFKAAQEWRDRVLALLPPMTSRQLCTLVRSSNTSGIPGIYRVAESSYVCWKAMVELKGKRQVRSFSVKKYGEEQARQMAIEARRQMLQAMPNRFWVATEASLDLTTQALGNPDALATGDAVVWDAAAKERFLARLQAEGLIDKPSASPVQKHHFASRRGPVWQSIYIASDGKRILRRFSVAKHGDKEAKRLAWQAYERLKEEFSPAQPSQPPARLSDRFNANPSQLVDAAIRQLALKNDAALARTIGVRAPTISKIRNRRIPVGASLLVRLLELTGLHIRDLYRLVQDEAMREHPVKLKQRDKAVSESSPPRW